MSISYVKADPSGNITGLVLSPVAFHLRASAAERVFSACPDMEQLGFVSPCRNAHIRLDMSGGEFCGNATLSAAALYLKLSGKTQAHVRVSVSGAAEPLPVSLRKSGEDEYSGSVDMPLPKSVGLRSLPGGFVFPVVEFDGISHVIVSGPFSDTDAMELISPWCEALGADALGIMLFDEKEMDLRPLVWVPVCGTLFWEHSCASGSSAVGAWLAQRDAGPKELILRQPGGNVGVSARVSGEKLTKLSMLGSVRLHDAKTLEII